MNNVYPVLHPQSDSLIFTMLSLSIFLLLIVLVIIMIGDQRLVKFGVSVS